MPTKAIAYTQQPVAAGDVVNVHFDRVNGGVRVTSQYEVRDQGGAIQRVGSLLYNLAGVASFTGADLLSRINTQEGT